jgi:hypothetical protein
MDVIKRQGKKIIFFADNPKNSRDYGL